MAKSWASYLTSLQLGFFTCEMGITIPTSWAVLSTVLTYCRCSVTRNYFPTLFTRTCSFSSLTFISPNPFPPIKSSLSLSVAPSHLDALPHLYSCYYSLFLILWYTIFHAFLLLPPLFFPLSVPGNHGEIDLEEKQSALIVTEDEKWQQEEKTEQLKRIQDADYIPGVLFQ